MHTSVCVCMHLWLLLLVDCSIFVCVFVCSFFSFVVKANISVIPLSYAVSMCVCEMQSFSCC